MRRADVESLSGSVPDGRAAGNSRFAAFYRGELTGQVRRAALLLGSETLAADVVHDAFAAVYDRWDTLTEPGPYLNRAVLNGCRDVGRRSVRRRAAIDRLQPVTTAPEHEVLWDVLSGLPFNQRAAVVLRFYAGFTESEIAAALDCPVGSVGPWISRALAAMRKELS